jgi:hypothetical protein
MKNSLRLVGITLGLVAAHSFAEMVEVPVDDGTSDPVEVEADFFTSYVGSADVHRRSIQVNDFDEVNSLARILVLPRTKIGIVRLGAEYEIYAFDVPEGLQVPDRLQSLALIIGLDTKFSDELLVRFEAKPGLYSADDFQRGDLNVPFILGGTYLYSSTLQFVFGVGVDLEGEFPVLPGGGVRWKFAPQWVLNATLPTPRLEYELNRQLTLYAGGELRSKTFRVDNDFVGDAHEPGRLNNAVLTYTEVRLGGGFTWKISETCKLSAEAGFMPWRQFDYHRTPVRYHSESGAPYAALAFHGSF